MALRILSAMVFIPNGGAARGNIVIGFNPFAIIASSNPAFQLRKEQQIGPRERFLRRPVSMIAARQFDIVPIARDWRVQISDTVTRDSITIRWNTSASRVDHEEIPFLIIGEVPDYVSISQGSSVAVRQPSDVLRRGSARSSKRKSKKR